MYADPSRRHRFSPTGAGAALLVNAGVVSALIFAVPQVFHKPPPPTFPIRDYKEPPVPPPVTEKKKDVKPEEVRDTVIYQPPIEVETQIRETTLTVSNDPPREPPPIDLGTPKGTGEVKVEPIAPPPPFLPAVADPRFARDFQPDYPASEIRLEREGKVTVRVRIGIDGRVLAVEQVRATSPAFYEATRRHAFSHWRFKPATRGGKAEESWKTMNVTFVLNGG